MNGIFLIVLGFYCAGFLISPVVAAPPETAQAKPCTPKVQDLSQIPDSIKQRFEQRVADIQAMDANCDGVLQPAELNKSANSKFNAADVNKDGVISASEASGMVEDFRQSDQPPGTLVDKHAKTLETRLNKMDADANGSISPAEYSAFYTARYQEQDKNKDGVIDIKEYRTDTESHNHKRKN